MSALLDFRLMRVVMSKDASLTIWEEYARDELDYRSLEHEIAVDEELIKSPVASEAIPTYYGGR